MLAYYKLLFDFHLCEWFQASETSFNFTYLEDERRKDRNICQCWQVFAYVMSHDQPPFMIIPDPRSEILKEHRCTLQKLFRLVNCFSCPGCASAYPSNYLKMLSLKDMPRRVNHQHENIQLNHWTKSYQTKTSSSVSVKRIGQPSLQIYDTSLFWTKMFPLVWTYEAIQHEPQSQLMDQGVTLDGAELEDLEVEGPKERLQVPEMGGRWWPDDPTFTSRICMVYMFLVFYLLYMKVGLVSE